MENLASMCSPVLPSMIGNRARHKVSQARLLGTVGWAEAMTDDYPCGQHGDFSALMGRSE